MFSNDRHDLLRGLAYISGTVNLNESDEATCTNSPKAKVIEMIVKIFRIIYIMFSLLCCFPYYTFGMFLFPFI